jgi:hypothetical protein
LRLERQGNSGLGVFERLIKGEASHDLLEAKTGYNAEYMWLRGYVPGYCNRMSAWLRKHTGLER